MYKLRLSRREKKKLLRFKWVALLFVIVAAAFAVWLIWIRPIQRDAGISSFDECVKAGNPVQETYPEVCFNKSGKRFVNPKQSQAHEASLANDQELVPPSNPALLKLDIDEWGVRVPLTPDTFDLSYAYIKDNGIETAFFTYKRLVRLDACKGDIGLALTRSYVQHEPPFTADNPDAIARIGNAYFYATLTNGSKPCYDTNNPTQVALVKQIAGSKTLVQATTDLLHSLQATPSQQ